MTRNFFYLVLACLLFAAASADAGEQASKRHWRMAPDLESFDHATGPVAGLKLSKTTAATQVGSTWYDYMWNGGSPTRLVYHNGVSYMLYVGRTAAADPREATYVSYDGSTYLSPTPAISGSVQTTYFSGIDVFRGGAVDGIAGVAAGWAAAPNGSYWCVEATPGAGDFAQFPSSDDRDTQPLILDSETGEVLIYTTAGRTDYAFVRSTDFGVNWADWNTGILGQGSAPGDQAQGTLDVTLLLAPNGDIIVGTTITGAGEAPPYGTTDVDSADQWGYFTSADGGATFTWTKIAADGEEWLPGFYSLAENFSGGDFAVDGNGNVHAVSNGYSIRARDTSGSIGVTYWNATVGFKELTTGLFDKEWDIISNDVLTYYPGNAIGCAYPTMAVSDDGQIVVVVWSQPGFTETTIDTLGGYLLHDLYYNYSADGGATWGTPTALTNTPDGSELFATLADDLEINGTTVKARVLYLKDTTPGASPFAESDAAEEPIEYMEFEFNAATSVEPIEGTVPETYAMQQNYPNPFNPTTNIVYSIPQSTVVTLKVYDLLGSEVATLVNEFQNAGSYTVDFNAADLANGAYFYRLTAGSFTDVKKMVLMK